jgi:hypothetical protein
VVRSGADFGINDNTLQSISSSGDFPEITTRITGLPNGTYAIWAFFWEQVVSTAQNWGLTAGLNSGSLTTYSAPLSGHSRPGTATADVINAASLTFTTPVKTRQVSDGSGGFLQNLFGVKLGEVTVAGGSPVSVFVDNNLVGTTNWRVAFDGVGYQPVIPQTETPAYTRLLGIDFNRDDAPGSPSQSGFRVISGSAANQAVVSSLSADLNVQGSRPGITYNAWSGGNPLLADPDGDGDGDGDSNALEYGGGTGALDPSSRPVGAVSFEDLTSIGLGDSEVVFSLKVAANRDDLSLLPSTSTDLLHWSFEPLEFLDAIDRGGSSVELRFRLGSASGAAHFFRFGASLEP